MMEKITPQNTVIAFDLHDVLFTYNYIGIVKELLRCKKKFRLILIFLNPRIWFDIIRLKRRPVVKEQYLLELPKKYPKLKPYIQTGINIANSQTPNKQMIALVKTLNAVGYPLQIFSNIGETIYKNLEQKFPDIFELFDKTTLPAPSNGYTRKPSQQACTNLLIKNPGKNIIFIDDKRKNIKIAQANGITGIQFRSPQQLKKEFQALKIL